MKRTLLRSALMLIATGALSAPLLGQPTPAATGAAATQPATKPVDPNKVVITVGEEKITAAEFDEFVKELPPQYQAMAGQPGPIRRSLAEDLVKVKLMAAEAKARKLDETPQYKRQLELIRQQVLANALAQDVAKTMGDAAMQKYYDEHKDEYARVKARHILIRTKDSPVPAEEGAKELTDAEAKAKADDIRKRIVDKKEDFAAIAKAESADKGSGSRGGELGTFGRGRMVPEFDEAAFGLKEGEVSQPVKTPYGYHLIQVTEKQTPPFEEMKKQIEQQLGPERLEALVEDLKKKHAPKIDDEFFGAAAPMMPEGGMAPPR